MDAKALKEITSELNLLYVEDDENLRTETAKLFGHLFKSVDTAKNGKLGLEAFLKNSYDLIITDINMPIMNGVELCQEIRKSRKKVTIIITSAHDESSYLLELIDIGIDKFILKPLDMSKLISILLKACTNIVNEKLILRYKEEIERTNIELKESNSELETLVKILDTKIEQFSSSSSALQEPNSTTPIEAVNRLSKNPPKPVTRTLLSENGETLHLYTTYVSDLDIKSFESLENEINEGAKKLTNQGPLEAQNIISLGALLTQYGEILESYPVFKTMGNSIVSLGVILKWQSETFIELASKIYILLKSFLYVLHKHREELFIKGIKDPNIYDTSMKHDIETIILILGESEETIEEQKEFF